MHFPEQVDVIVQVDSSEFLEYVRTDEVGAVREIVYFSSSCGLVGSGVVVVFYVGELVNGTGVIVCGIFQRYVDEVFGDVSVDVDGLRLHVVVGGVDGNEMVESEI